MKKQGAEINNTGNLVIYKESGGTALSWLSTFLAYIEYTLVYRVLMLLVLQFPVVRSTLQLKVAHNIFFVNVESISGCFILKR